ncbi:unnamed protein product, partial [Symbiodinium sp. KB8]
QDWIADPKKNPLARKFSFQIVIDAAAWIPISVSVGKTNALVEWFMGIAQDNLLQALLSSCIAALLTFSCALMTHLAMKYCRGVASRKGQGLRGFLRFFLLATITCLGWAVAWSNWALVLSVVDALEPSRSDQVVVAAVIAVWLVLSVCFYLRFGPEPIIPDPQLQQLCYSHGYSSSVQRSFVSYIVYSCVVCLVMACCDPTYGLLIVLASRVYSSTSSMFDAQAWLVLCSLAIVVTLLGALCSAAITWVFKVDEFSSMRLSRSVNDACSQMVTRRRVEFGEMLSRVQKAGSDACLVEDTELSNLEDIPLDEDDDEEDFKGSLVPTPRCKYASMPSDEEAVLEVESERQLQLNPGAISSAICVSVLIYDVLGFVVCFQWGMLVVRGYSVAFGSLAMRHSALYAVSCIVYASAVTVATTRLVMVCFASPEEQASNEAYDEVQEEDRRERCCRFLGKLGLRHWWVAIDREVSCQDSAPTAPRPRMSYTTMDRYGEVKHIYAPAKANQYVKGIWWPDYGPMTIDFCDQVKMHPTNTIFENQIAKPVKSKRDLLARPFGSRGAAPEPQFRRQPHTEALWSSTIIQPYKSGGRKPETFEGAWHRKAHQSHNAHEEAQAEQLALRSMRQQEMSATFSPKRSMSTASFSRSFHGGLSPLSREIDLPVGSGEVPSWVASSTISSRPLDAAGLNGNARGSVYRDGASEAGLDPESATARVLARSRSTGFLS